MEDARTEHVVPEERYPPLARRYYIIRRRTRFPSLALRGPGPTHRHRTVIPKSAILLGVHHWHLQSDDVNAVHSHSAADTTHHSASSRAAISDEPWSAGLQTHLRSMRGCNLTREGSLLDVYHRLGLRDACWCPRAGPVPAYQEEGVKDVTRKAQTVGDGYHGVGRGRLWSEEAAGTCAPGGGWSSP
ncbi:hypothetical protein GY45DRAFT_544857 [Cubamyces sp. BRFM 1775]|nr:hypothetical protein GY45DRAFT_544857 [Cubamyces sp. BRFM 1775]